MSTLKIRFYTDLSNPYYGKIKIDSNTDYGPNTTHKYSVQSPAGVFIKSFPVLPDVTGQDGSILVDIPLDYSSAFLQGNYIFRIQIDEDGAGSNVMDEQKTFCFKPGNLLDNLSVDVVVDCFAKKLVVTDNTEYPSPSVLSRSISVQHPIIPYESNESDSVTTSSQLVVDLTRGSGVAYENVSFDISVTANIDLQVELDEINSGEDSWDLGVVYAYVPYSNDQKIVCNFDPCKILSCVDSKYREILNTACKRGGVANLSTQDAGIFGLINSYLAMYNYWRLCKDYDKTNYYYSLLKSVVSECGCPEPVGAQPITESGIIYLAGESAYQIWINAGNEGTVEDFFNSLYPVGEWIEVDESYYTGNYEHGTIPLSYRILKTHIEFKGGFKAVIGATPSNDNPLEILTGSFNPAEIDSDTFVPVFSDNLCSARFFRDTDGGWKVRWAEDVFNDTLQNTMSGMLALSNIATSAQITPGDWTVFPSEAYSNGYAGAGSTQLQWKTDGKFLFIKGAFSGVAFSSSGLTLINSTYLQSIGVSLENGYNFALLDVDSTGTKGAPGYCKILNNEIIVSTRPAGDDFSASHHHAINGLIPLA